MLTLIKPRLEYINEISVYKNYNIIHGETDLQKFENIKDWISFCHLMENKKTIPIKDWVEAEQFMLIDKNDSLLNQKQLAKNQKKGGIIGMVNFRHYLNDYLAEYGGHIGYGINPFERQKGYGKQMLLLCLTKCWEFGLNKVLILCDYNNIASQKTILACSGIFERTIKENRSTINKAKNRYWINRP
jgi:predicted acetyltransferase